MDEPETNPEDPSQTDPSGVPDEAAMPTRIGRFAVLSKLGQGGMGIVYSGYDEELDRRVAIKVLRKTDPKAEARMRREAQAMAKVVHPNVAHVYEVGIWKGQLYLAIEFVKGRTLKQWLAEKKRGLDEILAILVQAGEGLNAAHEAGLAHRDFKPDNVMVGEDGRVRVLDFGLAGLDEGDPPDPEQSMEERLEKLGEPAPGQSPLQSPLTETGRLMGTPAYMSPEQFGVRAVGTASDQFSYCVALYEAVYGERPFDGNSVLSIGLNVSKGERRPVPKGVQVPQAIVVAIDRGLSTEEAGRFPTMRALLDELHRPGSSKPAFTTDAVVPTAAGAVGAWTLCWPWPAETLSRGMRGDPMEWPDWQWLVALPLTMLLVVLPLTGTVIWVLAAFGRRRGRRGQTRRVAHVALAAALAGLPVFLLTVAGNPQGVLQGGLAALVGVLAIMTSIGLAAPAVQAAKGRRGAVGWSVLASAGVPLLGTLLNLELGLWPVDAAFLPVVCAAATAIGASLTWQWSDGAARSPAGDRTSRIGLVAAPVLALLCFTGLYGFDSWPGAQTSVELNDGMAVDAAAAPGACDCESCFGGTLGPGLVDADGVRFTTPPARVVRVQLQAAGSGPAFRKAGSRNADDPVERGVYFVGPGDTDFAAIRPPATPALASHAYCVNALNVVPNAKEASTADVLAHGGWVLVAWHREAEQDALWRATLRGNGEPGAAVWVELPTKILGWSESSTEVQAVAAVPGGERTNIVSEGAESDFFDGEPLRTWGAAVGDDGNWSLTMQIGGEHNVEDLGSLLRGEQGEPELPAADLRLLMRVRLNAS